MKVTVVSIASLLLSLSVAPIMGATEKTFFEYNFNEPVKEDLVITQSTGLKGVHKELDYDLLEDLPEEPGNRALRLTRLDGLQLVYIRNKVSIPENCDYEISLRSKLGENGSCAIWFSDTDSQQIGALYFHGEGKRLLARNEKKSWTFSGIHMPINQWFTLKVNFYAGGGYKIRLMNQNGESFESRPMPFLSNKPFQEITFLICHPKGSNALWDDLKVSCSQELVIKNRVDALEGAKIFIQNSDNSSKSFSMLNDGDIRESALSRNIPLELNIDLSKPTTVSTIRLYGGDPKCAKFPSGACEPLSYTIEGLNTAGQWCELSRRKVSDKTHEDGTPESMYQQEDFSPIDISKLKIIIEDSSDTLKRASGIPAKNKVVALREIGLWGASLSLKDNQDNQFTKSVYGEFRLPVYQQQNIAGLHLYNDRKDKENHLVKIELRERYGDKLVQEARIVNLKYGENIIEFKLDGLPNGEYAASVIDNNDSQKTGDKFRRLLRLQRLDEKVDRNSAIGKMSGEKLYFPDAHYFEDYSNVKFSGTQAKVEQVVKPNSVPDGFIRHGQEVFLDKTGKIYLPFYTVDRFWSKESKKEFIAVQSDEDKEKWIISEMDPSYTAQKIKLESPLVSAPPAAAKPDWDIKYKNGEAPEFRFYDPQRDGEVNLNQVCFVNTRRYAGTTIMEKGKLPDWKIITPPPSSSWPVWYKAPGEAILLTKTQLLQDGLASGEFEELTNSNDNYVGQWLSDDGKILSFAKARILKRYPPFTAPYDNLPRISRIISIISTTDGINWKYSYMVPPDESDPPVAQHYGAIVNRIPHGNGLMMAFVYRYRAKSQQISIELAYSWDGVNWHRYAGQPAFVENGEPGSWNGGMVMTSSSAVAHKGTVYQLLSWVRQGYHLYGGILLKKDEATGAMVKEYYAGRDLESWPFFKYLGSYDAIAEDIRKAGVSVGIASYREGGLFFMSTKGTESGSFLTRPITASNGMTANVVIGKEGFFSVELLNNAGKVIPGYTRELSASDNIAMPIFKNLPDTPFRVSAKLKNTKLFSLNF